MACRVAGGSRSEPTGSASIARTSSTSSGCRAAAVLPDGVTSRRISSERLLRAAAANGRAPSVRGRVRQPRARGRTRTCSFSASTASSKLPSGTPRPTPLDVLSTAPPISRESSCAGPCVLARRQLRRSSRPIRRSTRRLERGRRATVTAARQLQRRRRRGPEPELKISNCRLDRPRKTREHGAHTAAEVLHEWLVPLEPRRRDYLWNERSSAAVVAAIHPFVAVRVAGRL